MTKTAETHLTGGVLLYQESAEEEGQHSPSCSQPVNTNHVYSSLVTLHWLCCRSVDCLPHSVQWSISQRDGEIEILNFRHLINTLCSSLNPLSNSLFSEAGQTCQQAGSMCYRVTSSPVGLVGGPCCDSCRPYLPNGATAWTGTTDWYCMYTSGGTEGQSCVS